MAMAGTLVLDLLSKFIWEDKKATYVSEEYIGVLVYLSCAFGEVIFGRLFGISMGGSESGGKLPARIGRLDGGESSYILHELAGYKTQMEFIRHTMFLQRFLCAQRL